MYDIGFINTNLIDEYTVKFDAKETEANLLRSLLQNQNKDTIIFPYNFKWVLLRVHIRFPLLLEQGYSNVIDELCMCAQLPLYSPGD